MKFSKERVREDSICSGISKTRHEHMTVTYTVRKYKDG
jgi:hypothetical protein